MGPSRVKETEGLPVTGKSLEFEELFMVQAPALYRTALRMTGQVNDAEDLVQETCLKAYRAFDSFEPATNFKAWVFRIMTNTLINQVRAKKKGPVLVDPDDLSEQLSASELPSTEDINEFLDDEIKAALQEIPSDFRDVLLLHSVEDLSYKEISESLEIPIGTVMSRLYRGRKLLQGKLATYMKKNYRQAHG